MKKVLLSIFSLVLVLSLSHLAAGQAVPNSSDDQLLAAAVKGDMATVRQSLANGANIEAKDNKDNTALIKAAMYDKTEIMNLLLDRGANIEARNRTGSTPLIDTAFIGNVDVVKLLLARGSEYQCHEYERRYGIEVGDRPRLSRGGQPAAVEGRPLSFGSQPFSFEIRGLQACLPMHIPAPAVYPHP